MTLLYKIAHLHTIGKNYFALPTFVLKTLKLWELLVVTGSWFQARVALHRNDRRANSVLTRGTSSSWLCVARVDRLDTWARSVRSRRMVSGARSSCISLYITCTSCSVMSCSIRGHPSSVRVADTRSRFVRFMTIRTPKFIHF